MVPLQIFGRMGMGARVLFAVAKGEPCYSYEGGKKEMVRLLDKDGHCATLALLPDEEGEAIRRARGCAYVGPACFGYRLFQDKETGLFGLLDRDGSKEVVPPTYYRATEIRENGMFIQRPDGLETGHVDHAGRALPSRCESVCWA